MSFNSWPLPHSSAPHALYSEDTTDKGKSTVDKPLQTRANLGSVRCACETAFRNGYSLKIDWAHGIHSLSALVLSVRTRPEHWIECFDSLSCLSLAHDIREYPQVWDRWLKLTPLYLRICKPHSMKRDKWCMTHDLALCSPRDLLNTPDHDFVSVPPLANDSLCLCSSRAILLV